MRTVTIGAVIVVLILSCGLTIRYNKDARYAIDQLNNERYQRLSLEEDFQKSRNLVGSLKAELQKTEEKVAQLQEVLDKTNAMNEDLKSRLQRAAEIKTNLDKKIEELQKLVLPM